MLVNLSNHPFEKWSENQKQAAKERFVSVFDYPFPNVNPNFTSEQVWDLARETVKHLLDVQFQWAKFRATFPDERCAVMVQGESGLTFALVTCFNYRGIPCVHATTERVTVDNPDGTKTSSFQFVRFRSY